MRSAGRSGRPPSRAALPQLTSYSFSRYTSPGGHFMDEDDWRLRGQQKYLSRVTLTRRQWRQSRPNWDHDHCQFCWATFAAFDGADILYEGWTTADEYHWVCDTCFADFRDRFAWHIGHSADSERT